MKELQCLAATNELRFELSKHTALAFLIRRRPEDLQGLAQQLSMRHSAISKQQTNRLDVAYCVLAAAANPDTIQSMPVQSPISTSGETGHDCVWPSNGLEYVSIWHSTWH